jgi:hypothetical protein
LENKQLLSDLDTYPLNLLAHLSTETKRNVVFIDEIQYLTDLSNFLKLIYDEHHERIKIVASGSSAFYLDNQFNVSLAGGKRVFQLLNCDFEDLLMLHGKEEFWEEVLKIKNSATFKSIQIAKLKVEWEQFMIYGGYPRVVTEPGLTEKKEILKEIKDSFVKWDISESGVKNELVFHQLFKILAYQSFQLVSQNELNNTLRIRSETIQNYLRIMQVCFHVAMAKSFFSNVRKELVKMSKVYFLDGGLCNSLLNTLRL